MARAARTESRGPAAVALLLLGLVAIPRPAAGQAAALPGAPGAAIAGPDSAGAGLVAQAVESPPSAASDAGAGFTIRRVANPRYRVFASPAGLAGRVARVIEGTQFARAQFTRRESGAFQTTDWEIAAGREGRGHDRLELWASGFRSTTDDQLRLLRLAGQNGRTEWGLGDVVPQPVGTLPWIQRLRGGMAVRALERQGAWRALGGVVPSFSPGVGTIAGLAGVTVDQLPWHESTMSFGVLGFGRRALPPGAGSGADTLGGGGGAALYAARVPSALGDLTSTFVTEVHNLDGNLALAGIQALDWTLSRPWMLAVVRDQIGTANARQPGTERLSQAPSHEARASAQFRLLAGRAEAHLLGLSAAATPLAPAAHTAQAGFSAHWGASAWYSGFEFSWNRRDSTAGDERRYALQSGCVARGGSALLLRLERDTDPAGHNAYVLNGDASASLGAGLRVSFVPRLDWRSDRLDRALGIARFGCPLLGPTTRVNATVGFATERAVGYRGRLEEASIAFSFAPRSRDRGDLEVRRLEDGGACALEYGASYDLQTQLYARAPGSLVSPSTGTLTVTVVRADRAGGVPDVLVSADGKELRFTDVDGIARFTNLAPGSHAISVIETTLPALQRVVGAASAFVAIERGVAPAPLRFEIARPVRRVRF